MKAAQEPAATQGEAELGPGAGRESKDAGSSGRGAGLSRGRTVAARDGGGSFEALRAKQEKQRELIRSKAEAKALRELEKKKPPRNGKRCALEKLGEKQKAMELREQARREAQQEQARLKREAAAAREFNLKRNKRRNKRAKAASADRKRRLMEGKVEEAERRRLLDIEAKAKAAKARPS